MKEICEMNYEELLKLQAEVNEEVERRYDERKHKAWLVVTNAIKEYCKVYGVITVNDGYDVIDIDERSDFTSEDEIITK